MKQSFDRKNFDRLLDEADRILAGDGSAEEKLSSLCRLLHDNVPHYDWVGWYLVDSPGSLVLGPYCGAPTEHTQIPFGRGICGQAAGRGEVFLVQDVTTEDNYLSCSVDVKSEIVVPVIRDGRVRGELDIDSHTLWAFSVADREFLEEICDRAGDLLPGV